jgi:hypothetical protein
MKPIDKEPHNPAFLCTFAPFREINKELFNQMKTLTNLLLLLLLLLPLGSCTEDDRACTEEFVMFSGNRDIVIPQ